MKDHPADAIYDVDMPSVTQKRRTDQVNADRAELAERIGLIAARDGRVEAQPGVHLVRASTPSDPVYGVTDSCFCVIAQGAKHVMLGDDRFRYDPNHYLISTAGLPTIGQVDVASRDEPYLGFKLVLDPAIVTSVIVDSGRVQPTSDGGVKAIDVSPLDADLLNATLRLVRLVEKKGEFPVLGPLVIREIIFRLLNGTQGNRLRHLATFGGQAHRMVRAVNRLREDFDKPLRIEDLAGELGMSASGFHAHFKAVTAMSPLQFQKQLRLQEARRLMVSENFDAAGAGYRVGYEDPSHFSREYKRQFGKPPMADVEGLRALA